ncbi:acyl-CoA dehydrogenase family protein [Arthrobacter sp. zg-Y769]|uniref:acyl-CoA dehydrogenase family protein n=1 Tax=Arthrobacter sp. zg-Y769 TaxID=2894191 RepID=UPI001E37F7BC|nr:acyl-CoA dehydrogenase family protein [Arthrobacter sp. zg-Y769]MCC9204900.1 acyl-CoA dehydrogenase family protein [Arthrobacter sp. zg-Y769]
MTVTQSERPAFDPTALDGIDADLYLLDELLDDEARDVRDRVRAFVDNDLLPVINDYWERAEVPFELVPKLAALNIAGGTIKGYGCPGLSRMAASTAAAELARGDGSINTFFGVHSGLAMGSIDMLGSEEQKQRWLPAMARFEKIGAFALTEPTHGSDSVSLETTARRDGDSYVLNGNKRWIGNASFADIVIIYARDEADGAVKAFVMEKDADGNHPAGYRADVITGKIGKRAVLQPDIVIEDLRIPAANRLQNCNSFKDVNKVLAATRGGVAWEALGHAVAAYEIAVAYAKDRVQFGRPIAGFQLVQNKLANMLAQVTAIKLTCFRLNELGDQGKMTGPMASMAKMFAARQGRWVCSEARDIMGGNGLLLENHVARHLTDMEVVFTYEGTDSMQSLILGRHITGLSAFA